VVRWSGHGNAGKVEAREQELWKNIERIFRDKTESLSFVSAAELSSLSIELLDADFLSSVELLGDRDFLSRTSRVMGHRFGSYHDINAGRPERTQARSLIEHTMRGWLIYKYLDKVVLPGSDGVASIGHLMWERELAKTLVLNRVRNDRMQGTCIGYLMGKDVTYRSGIRKQAIPTFDEETALEVFAPLSDIVRKCNDKSVAELAATNAVVHSILKGNRQSVMDGLPAQVQLPEGKRAARQVSATVIGLRTLRKMYGLSE
jgi:hypothetical protein